MLELARAVAAIDRERMLATLSDLVAIRSLGGEAGELEIQHYVADLLEQWGCDVDRWDIDLDAVALHPSFSAEIDRSVGIGVVGTYGSDGPTLILNGHTDVVPAGDVSNWHHDPWQTTVADGHVYGRGTVDMKGGLVCALFALKAVVDAGVTMAGCVKIQAVIGEEDGGTGTLASVLRGHTGDAAIIMEPTGLAIAPQQAGCFNFRVTIPGKAAHGAIRYEGVDPIEKFMAVYTALLVYEEQRNTGPHPDLFAGYMSPYPIAVGTIRAGVWASTVAEELTFEGRYGIKVGEDLSAARRSFEAMVAEAAAQDTWLRYNPPHVEWWGGQFEPALTPVDDPIVSSVANAYEAATSEKATLRGMPFGADMRLLVNEGQTPTVMFGPGDVRLAHYADEYVPLDELWTCTETLVRTIVAFCGESGVRGAG